MLRIVMTDKCVVTTVVVSDVIQVSYDFVSHLYCFWDSSTF